MRLLLLTSFLTLFSVNDTTDELEHASTQSQEIQIDQNELLSRHNFYRKQVDAPALKWSDSLADYAQEWANHLAKHCEMKHRPDADGLGENIYWTSGERTAKQVVDYWAQEEELFNHRRPVYKSGKGYGHYTQIIWRETKYMGGAAANCKHGGQIWVCNYDPPGNWEDERVY